jgi:hypothetical protein
LAIRSNSRGKNIAPIVWAVQKKWLSLHPKLKRQSRHFAYDNQKRILHDILVIHVGRIGIGTGEWQ